MDKKELLRLIDENGRVIRYPSKYKKRVYAVLYIAEKFESGRIYTELEVNELIRANIAFDDYVLIRRDLVDYHCLSRERDGSRYERAAVLPNAEDIIK